MAVDQHYTPAALAKAIVDRVIRYGDLRNGDTVCDPGSGQGAFTDAVISSGLSDTSVTPVDNDPSAIDCRFGDFLTLNVGTGYNLVIGNPPYSLAEQFVYRAMSIIDARGTVAFLLTLQFLGSVSRREFFSICPPSTIDVIRPRPSFALDGATDAREYALFRWCPQDFASLKHSGARMGFLDWTKPRREKRK
jgi:hypothetical protein